MPSLIPSPIENVFAMSEPQHMLSKLLWEINGFTQSQSVWVDNETFPTPIFRAWNAAVTAWHITDWLWASKKQIREKVAAVHGFVYEETTTGIRRGLEKFQEAAAIRERSLYVCREIANGSKHMRRTKSDPDIKAKAVWREAVDRVGLVVPGELVLSLEITDGQNTKDALRWFIDAFAYWENLFRENDWISVEMRLPDKIIKVGRLKEAGIATGINS